MRTRLKQTKLVLLGLWVALLLTACGGNDAGIAQGLLSIALTDAATDSYQAVYVTVARVEVHADSGDGWETVAAPNQTYNLLDLVNGARESLGIATLDSGHYNQMRLILGATPDAGINILSQPHPYANYVIDQSDTVQELTAPSGLTTGLKIVGGFDIYPDQTTDLTLDFDATQSVVIAGSSGQYQIKPTVKVLAATDAATVFGVGREAGAASTVLLDGALVTAQVADATSPDPRDQVVIEGGTMSATDGSYALLLAPGDYNLVAVRDDYLPTCSEISLPPSTQYAADFALTLAPTPPGAISGSVSIADAGADQVVTLEFRQELTCDGAAAPTMITVRSLNVANGGAFDVTLPDGTYQVVAATAGRTTRAVDTVVTTAATTDLGDLAF